VNGRVSRGGPAGNEALGPHWNEYAERNQLFANEGAGRFRDVSLQNEAFCGTPLVSRGLAVGDVDNDGALDLLVTTARGPPRLCPSRAREGGRWALVRGGGPALRRGGYGAPVTVGAARRSWLGWVNPGQGYLCSNVPRVPLGLGGAGRVGGLHGLWPD